MAADPDLPSPRSDAQVCIMPDGTHRPAPFVNVEWGLVQPIQAVAFFDLDDGHGRRAVQYSLAQLLCEREWYREQLGDAREKIDMLERKLLLLGG
jgi:hypothetical protein